MVTRFRLTEGGTPSVSPAYSSAWVASSLDAAVRRPLVPATQNTPLTDVVHQRLTGGGPHKILGRQYVSQPLAADTTISGNFTITIAGRGTTSGSAASVAVVVRVVSKDGTVERGVLCDAVDDIALPFTSGQTSDSRSRWLSVAVNPVNALANDRVVVEIGGRIAYTGSFTTRHLALVYGDPSSGSDFVGGVENEGMPSPGIPWVEFSQDLTFGTPENAAELSGSGLFSVTRPLAADELDLSTAIPAYGSDATYNGHLYSPSNQTMYFLIPAVYFDHAKTYRFEVAYERTSTQYGGGINLNSSIGPTPAEAETSQGAYLGDGAVGFLQTRGVETFEVGPGQDDWATAQAAGEHYVMFTTYNIRVTGIKWTPDGMSGPAQVNGEFTGSGAFTATAYNPQVEAALTGSGEFTAYVESALAPVNNRFANAINVPISVGGDTWVSDPVDNRHANAEPGEPEIVGSSVRSVWYKYTPVASGVARFSTGQSLPIPNPGGSFITADTIMAVYTGTELSNLSLVAFDQDDGDDNGEGNVFTAEIRNFAVEAGTTYWIQVGAEVDSDLMYSLAVTGPVSVLPPTLPEEIAADNPILWWRNEDPSAPADSSGHGRVPQTVVGVTQVEGAGGSNTYALGQSGSVYYDGGDAGDTGWTQTTDWTLVLWLRTTIPGAPNFSSAPAIARVGNKSFLVWDTKVRAGWGQSAGGVTGNNVFDIATINDGEMHMFAMRKSGLVITVYRDGVLTNTFNLSSEPSSFGDDAEILGWNFTTVPNMTDELQYYDYAIAPARIAAQWDAGMRAPTLPVTFKATSTMAVEFADSFTLAVTFESTSELKWLQTQDFGPETIESVGTLDVVITLEGDDKTRPIEISGWNESRTFSLTSATLAAGESVPAGVTRTLWLRYTSGDGDIPDLRFLSAHPNATIRLYDATGTILRASGTPIDLTYPIDSGTQYMVQIGLPASVDGNVTLSWIDATPQDYDNFETPIMLGGDFGYEWMHTVNGSMQAGEPYAGSYETSSWGVWTSDNTTEVTFSATTPPGSTVRLTVYTGSTIGGLTQVATGVSDANGEVEMTFPVVEGGTYRVQIAAGGQEPTAQVRWRVAPTVDIPATPADHARLIVYYPDGITQISEIPRRTSLSFQEPLNEPGTGEVTVNLNDPIMQAYPDLLDWRNVVKVWIAGQCVHGFRIRRRRTNVVSSDEARTTRTRTVSGPSVQNMLDDIIVRHNLPLQDRRSDERFFGWAAPQHEWFRDDLWTAPYNQNNQKNPPSNLSEDPEDRAKYDNPPGWPDPSSKWLWLDYNPDKNDNNYAPPPLKLKRFYRKGLYVPKRMRVKFFVTADEKVKVYVDGELLIEGDGKETGYTSFERKTVILNEGWHTVGIMTRSVKQATGDGADAVMLTAMRVNDKGKLREVLLRTDNDWKSTWTRPVPAWNRAGVMRAVMREARERGNRSALAIGIGFELATDSAGNTWFDRINENVAVGTSALALQQQFSEDNGFDVWLDPGPMVLKAWRKRGVDRSATVTLEAGRNLMDWEVEEVEEVRNDFLIRYEGGWTQWSAPNSVARFGASEALVSLGRVESDDDAERVVRRASAGFDNAQKRAGTSDLRRRPQGDPQGGFVAVEGARPFLDFGVGDIVKAPDENNRLRRHRVLALSCAEDESGHLSYDADLEEVK